MKKFKKILAMGLTVVMALSVMGISALASWTEDTNVILGTENGVWEYVPIIESTVTPLATDNNVATFTVPVSPNYCDVSPNKLRLSNNENAIGIDVRSFDSIAYGPSFNIMNVTDNTWVSNSWMSLGNPSTPFVLYYTFNSVYLAQHGGDTFAVKMRTSSHEATTTLRTFTTKR